ncbi:hypothetical protein [Salicibibacter halophilus]|nr:hypothetical protein [Salicibibacter halophilus]
MQLNRTEVCKKKKALVFSTSAWFHRPFYTILGSAQAVEEGFHPDKT